MFSAHERRQADRFYADLMGLSRSGGSSSAEKADESPDLRNGRVVFYNEDTLRFIEGWTRADGRDRVFLINRRDFTPIRDDGRKRSRLWDDYIARYIRGQRDLMEPARYEIDNKLHTVPLNPRSGGWDDLMISELIAVARPVTIQSEHDQWIEIKRIFAAAEQAAKKAGPRKPAQEFVDFFVLDNVQATLTLVPAPAGTVTMQGFHAHFNLGRVRRTGVPALRPGELVVGDIHTHALLDPFINTTSTATGTTIAPSLHSGVSDVDTDSAKSLRFVVYAVDSRHLHRANPDGTKNDRLKRSGNVLREALRIFGGEPR